MQTVYCILTFRYPPCLRVMCTKIAEIVEIGEHLIIIIGEHIIMIIIIIIIIIIIMAISIVCQLQRAQRVLQ